MGANACELFPGEAGFREPITDENRQWYDGAYAEFRWHRCPNIEAGYSDFDGESYDCKVCGYHYKLYYDEMC